MIQIFSDFKLMKRNNQNLKVMRFLLWRWQMADRAAKSSRRKERGLRIAKARKAIIDAS